MLKAAMSPIMTWKTSAKLVQNRAVIIRTTMKRSLITALILCSISWISVSRSESHTETVEGRPGGEVTLTCSNPSIRVPPTLWLRVVNRTKASWISTMTRSTGTPLYSDVNQNGRFNMSTNISTLFLQIKQVDVSDSGLYLCGFYIEGRYDFSAIHFNVKDSDDSHDDTNRKSENSDESHDDDDRKSEKSDGTAKLMSLILGALTVLLLMVNIGLVVKNRKLQKAANEEQNPQQPENLDSDLKDAALSLYAATIRKRRPASEREVETHAVYAVCR
ncbi:uncharacterized protein LOC120572366 isoform X2 [Perca fluviatilis]|uniref:uncharacterized protein LOC120572366 isoform X2 n=1 Tax=Perca fluviatilis TaxID=8168 RepID=UPI00196229B2|nr:uncharacterized protein LOC120572366 isoform X2 [Perca fluviatilis]